MAATSNDATQGKRGRGRPPIVRTKEQVDEHEAHLRQLRREQNSRYYQRLKAGRTAPPARSSTTGSVETIVQDPPQDALHHGSSAHTQLQLRSTKTGVSVYRSGPLARQDTEPNGRRKIQFSRVANFLDGFTYGGINLNRQCQRHFKIWAMTFTSDMYPAGSLELPIHCARLAIKDGDQALQYACCLAGALYELGNCEAAIRNSTGPLDYDAHRLQLIIMRYKERALKLTRSIVKDSIRCSSDSALALVSLLRFVETYTGNKEGAKSHALGLERMVASRGSLEDLEPQQATDLYITEITGLHWWSERPIFPITSYWKTRIDELQKIAFQPLVCAYVESICMGFLQPPFSDTLSSGLLRCLRAFRTLSNTCERARRNPLSETVKPHHSVSDDLLAIEQQLSWLPYESKVSPSSTTPAFEEMIRSGALIFDATALWHVPPVFFAHIAAMALKIDSAISEYGFVPCLHEAPEVMLWACFMGHLALSGQVEHERVASAFKNRLIRAAERLGVNDFGSVRAVLERYLYLDYAHSSLLLELFPERTLTFNDIVTDLTRDAPGRTTEQTKLGTTKGVLA